MTLCELFESRPFLEMRLGTEPFQEIPKKPGIYRFYDEDNILLYVGKAKNLRRRLFTYKRAKPGKTSRKEAALISRIHRFEFDVLGSEKEALLHENRWIREHRPEFNYANKHTETYYFITVQRNKNGLLFGLSMNSSGKFFSGKERPLYQEIFPPLPEGLTTSTYGSFKGHRPVRRSMGALLQLLWMSEHKKISPHFLPVQLSRNLTPLRFKLFLGTDSPLHSDEMMKLLDEWFLGRSPDLVEFLLERMGDSKESAFSKNFLEENLETLLTYFHRNLERHRIIRETWLEGQNQIIEQDQLDDLITKFKLNG